VAVDGIAGRAVPTPQASAWGESVGSGKPDPSERRTGGASVTRGCRWVWFGFLLLYLAALFLFAVGTFGLFGSPRGPLAGVFLVPLGLPWNLWIDFFPPGLRPWLAAGAPIVNLLAIRLVCRARRSRRQTRED
jgi:hypothetical protein